jgi:predicted GNAT superfamily acetyltransferase
MFARSLIRLPRRSPMDVTLPPKSPAAPAPAPAPASAQRSSRAAASPPAAGAPATGITVRPLASLTDYHACVALEREVWGEEFDGTIPANLMQVATYVGGIALGAFDVDGQLVGFVFGLTGVLDGKIAHWSHVLGVRTTLRNAGIGRMLKEYQRAELARRGIAQMYWTYDPLIAKNSHLNLDVLGARVVRYVPDMYGDTGSPLHHGLETDRLVVVCDTTPTPRPPRRPVDSPLPILSARLQSGDETVAPSATPPRVLLEIPSDFAQLLARAPKEAAEWHAATRRHFLWALGHGYDVIGMHFDRTSGSGRSFYLLDRTAPL